MNSWGNDKDGMGNERYVRVYESHPKKVTF